MEAGPCAAGYKTGADQVIALTEVALAILGALPKRRDRRVCPEFNYSRKKAIADKAVRLERWTLHDLRRTATTIMAKAAVRPDISERVLGHLNPAAEGVYDWHDCLAEKRDALERLKGAVDHIRYPVENVIGVARA